ncbi:MAG: HAD family hydrolase [Proteobacteria bacterium]|nr:HAD family hydrolase [Pseudomonadota bacterium]
MPPRFTLPQLVIFDWDNTLIENWQALLNAMNAALKTFNKPAWNQAQMIDNSKQSLRNSFPVIFGTEWEKARDIFYDHFNKNHLDGLKKLDGAEALLDFLTEHGVRLAVCSNKAGLCLRREVKHLGWRRYFISILGAQDAEKDKPDCAPVRLIQRLNGLEDCGREDVWFVGDTVSDMQCAGCAGVLPVGLGEGAKENPAFMPKLWAADRVELLTAFKQSLCSVPALPRVVNDN